VTAASAYTSLRASICFSPIACSGLMYCGVPSESPVCVMRCAAGLLHGERDAEVGDQRLPIVQQDVLGLDVAVDHALAMCVVERAGHLAGDAHRVGDRQLTFALEARTQRLAGDERHHVVQQAVGFAAVEQRQDVRMLQSRGGADLGEEALAAECGAEVGVQHLDGDIALVLEVVREVHGGHAASAEFALDAVAVGDWYASHPPESRKSRRRQIDQRTTRAAALGHRTRGAGPLAGVAGGSSREYSSPNSSQSTRNSAAMTGPATNPARPNTATPPSVETRTR
jgi:hypothetical protein